MANVLKQIFSAGVDQIDQSYTIEAWHVSQSVDAFTGAKEYDINLSGSLSITGSLFATSSYAYSGSKVFIASNASTNTNYTLVFKNSTGALGSHYELAADGANGPYYNPSTNTLTAGIISGSSMQAVSFTGSLSGSITGTASSATSASYAVTASYAAVTQQSNTFLGSILVSGSVSTTPTPGLQIIAGASKTNGSGVATVLLNELTGKTLGVSCFITTAPIGSGVLAVSVVSQVGATVIFQGDINTDFSFMVVYF
jgi:hypothetical protein